jgi:alpha-galactosidase
MMAHNLPRVNGSVPPPLFSFCDGGFFPGLVISEKGEKEFIDALERQKIKVDYWWIDAGWYPCRGNWPNTGTWEPDPERFPHGLKAISDYVHERKMKFIVWFEPERATPGSWLAQHHPEWLLDGKLINLGDPAARNWITDHIDRLIKEQGIDVYRQDFNLVNPLDYWKRNDTPDRIGMTENLHVQGYLAYWDELRKRNPGIFIDSCSGGGARNDLESMRRAVPLLRSDYQAYDGDLSFAIGNQCHTYGLSTWLPYYGQGVYIPDQNTAYYARSHMSPGFSMPVDVRKPGINWNEYRRLIEQWRSVSDCMLGDYYPLTPYSLEDDQWIAWQFHRPDHGDGFIQAFRRDRSPEMQKRLMIRGLEVNAQYVIRDLDDGVGRRISGKQAMEEGVLIKIQELPGSALWKYSKIK